jgi:nitroreductase
MTEEDGTDRSEEAAMSNPVFEAVRTMLAVREYQDREVPEDVLRRCVEAARLTASSMNRQPWHFILVRRRETLQEVGALAPTGRYVASAAAAVVVAVETESRFAVSDASRAIQSMMLTAWADGVGSNWVGFGGLENVAALFGVPDTHDVLAIVPLGYPRSAVGRGVKNRRPPAEVISAERFGRPLE